MDGPKDYHTKRSRSNRKTSTTWYHLCVEAKNNELDLYVSKKNTLIDSKISEVDNAKTQLQDSVNNKLVEVDNAEKQVLVSHRLPSGTLPNESVPV